MAWVLRGTLAMAVLFAGAGVASPLFGDEGDGPYAQRIRAFMPVWILLYLTLGAGDLSWRTATGVFALVSLGGVGFVARGRATSLVLAAVGGLAWSFVSLV